MPREQILITADQLESTVSGLAEKISGVYRNVDNVIALVMLEGARYFAKDLLAKLDFPIEAVFVKASSYYGRVSSAGHVRIDGPADLSEKIRGKHILLIDDIYDTGLTLAALLNRLADDKPQSVKICVLLEKDILHEKRIPIDFLGTKVPDAFVVGYGLDYDGRYRELPYLAVLSPESVKAIPEKPQISPIFTD
jgi:hypoxanthine phosphoribosyltransferase